jgi:hypothetical protein
MSYNGWAIMNCTKCKRVFGPLTIPENYSFIYQKIENFKLYKTVDFAFQVFFFCIRKIQKMNIYSIVQLRFQIFCRYISIYVSLCSSTIILQITFLPSIDGAFRALCVQEVFTSAGTIAQQKEA